MKQLFLLVSLFTIVNTVNFVELFGLTSLLTDLAKLPSSVNQTS